MVFVGTLEERLACAALNVNVQELRFLRKFQVGACVAYNGRPAVVTGLRVSPRLSSVVSIMYTDRRFSHDCTCDLELVEFIN